MSQIWTQPGQIGSVVLVIAVASLVFGTVQRAKNRAADQRDLHHRTPDRTRSSGHRML